MKLLGFGRPTKPQEPEQAPAMSTTRGGVVFLDDSDLTRYQNNYQLYDTGPRSGRVALDFQTAAPPSSLGSSAKPLPVWPQKSADRNQGYTDTVIMLDANSTRFHDTPIICEEDSTFAASDFLERNRKGSVGSIDVLPIPRRAIRTGGPAKLFGTQYVGLLVNWVLLGFVDGATQTLVTPLFTHYFHMGRFQSNAVATLLQFALLFKLVVAFICDACPIRGQRRKPYIYIGWALFAFCMVVLVGLPGVEPFLSTSEDTAGNTEAPSEGARYVVPLVVASFGHLCATVACEGIMVELAHREGEFLRGRTQCIVVACQLLGQCVGTLAVSLGANSVPFGGQFNGAVPVQAIFAVFGFFALVGIVCAWLFIMDEVNSPAALPVKPQLRRLGQIALRRPTWRLMVFGFVCTVALSYDIRESRDVYTKWLGSTQLELGLSRAAGLAGAAIASYLIFKLWVNTNWRRLLLGSLALGIVVAAPIEFITYFDVWRNLVFYFAKDFFLSTFDAVARLLQLLVIVEVAEPGFEASTYGLITTAYNLASPFAGIVTSVIVSTAGVERQDLTVDSSDVRGHVALEQVTKIAVRIVFIVAVCPLLPRQKSHARELNARGSQGRVLASVVQGAFLLVFLTVVTSNILSLVGSTSCLAFARGEGCEE